MAEPESVAHDANVRLKPLPGAKSKVWKFFGFATNENGTIAQGTVHALFISDRTVLVRGKPEELLFGPKLDWPFVRSLMG